MPNILFDMLSVKSLISDGHKACHGTICSKKNYISGVFIPKGGPCTSISFILTNTTEFRRYFCPECSDDIYKSITMVLDPKLRALK